MHCICAWKALWLSDSFVWEISRGTQLQTTNARAFYTWRDSILCKDRKYTVIQGYRIVIDMVLYNIKVAGDQSTAGCAPSSQCPRQTLVPNGSSFAPRPLSLSLSLSVSHGVCILGCAAESIATGTVWADYYAGIYCVYILYTYNSQHTESLGPAIYRDAQHVDTFSSCSEYSHTHRCISTLFYIRRLERNIRKRKRVQCNSPFMMVQWVSVRHSQCDETQRDPTRRGPHPLIREILFSWPRS